MNTKRHYLFGSALLSLVFAGILSAGEQSAQPKPQPRPSDVLKGLRSFFARTARADGSFQPSIDPDYEGMSDSAYSDLAPVTYAVILHKTFGWKLPHEDKTRELLLSRQQKDSTFVNVKGTGDPKSSQARLYNTTQGLVALHALGVASPSKR